jgi:formylglycine-generating enzyme required for sulfatase activity
VHETDAEAKRSLITQAIAEFAAPLAKCRVIVTCREYAYRQGEAWRLPEKDFPVVELDLFGEEQIEHFTRTWYQIVGPQKGWDKDKCSGEAKILFQAIHEWPHLQELAKYPLLLTLMAQVHGRDGSLPNDRADLYERAVNLLLAHWQNRIVRDVAGSRKVEPGLIMQLGVRAETLRLALERVAFAAHERQEKAPSRSESAADIPKEDLREELENSLGNAEKAKQVLAYIQERAGLLQARDNRTYTFPHRTFQEYLTATHLLKQGEYDTMLRDRMKRDLIWWRESFLLAAGARRSTPRIISDLVDGLVPYAPTPETLTPEKAAQMQAAAQALAETGFIEHVRKEKAGEPGRFAATYDKIQNGLLTAMRAERALAATERAAAGNALARLGDPRFRPDAYFLPDEPLLGFVEIPAGTFRMGSDKKKDPQAFDEEVKQHSIDLPAYYLGRYPVTVAQFQNFVNASGYKPENPESLQSLANHPVVNVTWHEALKYCDWLTERLRAWEETPEPLAGLLKQQNWRITLPSEAEWEKAARGTDGRIYPWGKDADSNRANYGDTGIRATSAVGCFPGGVSPYGCEEMSGNVWEWTRSLWGKNSSEPDFKYPYKFDDGREQLDATDDVLRVLRGGAFGGDVRRVRCAYRRRSLPFPRYSFVGFRVSAARPLL